MARVSAAASATIKEGCVNFAERYGAWAVVMGASEGTGREFARQIAAQGVPSILIARREAPLTALAKEILEESGVECITATLDLAAPSAADNIVKVVGDRQIGLFVSNAGSDPNGSFFLDRDLSAWIELVQRNVMTMMQCAYHFAGPMRVRGKGGLLLVNSGACYGGGSGMGQYCGSKAFTLCFAEALWAELRPHGVEVLTLVLNRTDTPAFRTLLKEKGMPMPDGVASPADVARVGLERLPYGPICNWGQADDERGMASSSAAERRERVLAIDRITGQLFGRR
jgi:short-subunit dehydrogenase